MIDRTGIRNYLTQLNNSDIPKIPLRHLTYFMSLYEGEFNKVDYFDHLSSQILNSMRNFISGLKIRNDNKPALEVWDFTPNGINFLIFCYAFDNKEKGEASIGNTSHYLYPFFAILQVDNCIYLSETPHSSSAMSFITLSQIIKIGTKNGLFQDDSKIFLLDKSFHTSKINYSSGVGSLVMDSKYLRKPQQAYSLVVEEVSPCYSKEALPITTYSGDDSNNLLLNLSTDIPSFSCVNLRFSYQITDVISSSGLSCELGNVCFNKEDLISFSVVGNELPLIIITKYNAEDLKRHIIHCIRQNNDGDARKGKKIIFNKFTKCRFSNLEPVMELISFGNHEMRKYLEKKYDDYCKYLSDNDEIMKIFNEHLHKIIQERENEKEVIGRLLFDKREELIV